jgi:hypothetical protein
MLTTLIPLMIMTGWHQSPNIIDRREAPSPPEIRQLFSPVPLTYPRPDQPQRKIR